MQISALPKVDKWPTRKEPQERFDSAVQTAMNQISTMVDALNNNFIPGANSIGDDVNTVSENIDNINSVANNITAVIDAHDNMDAINAAPGHAADAAESAAEALEQAQIASQKAEAAEQSATTAQNAQAAAEAAKNGADSARDAAQSAQSAAQTAKNAAEAAQAAAEQARDEAEHLVGFGVATVDTAGIVKPDGTTITVTEDGVISASIPLSDAIDSESSTTAASSKAVKTVMEAAISGDTTGNAATATKLQTARTISLIGAVTGSASFDGSEDITITTSGGSAAGISSVNLPANYFLGCI